MRIAARDGEVLLHLTPEEADDAFINYSYMILEFDIRDGLGVQTALSKAITAARDGGVGTWNDAGEAL